MCVCQRAVEFDSNEERSGAVGNALTASYQCQKAFTTAAPILQYAGLDSLQCGGSHAFHTEDRVGKYVTSLNLKVQQRLHYTGI